MEARGNSPSYPAQGVNFVRSTLTWGPLSSLASRLYGWQFLKRSTYAQQFHTYTLEWTENFIKIYVDSRLKNMVELQINTKQQSNGGFFWKRGNFPLTAHNNTADEIVVPNPWTTATFANATNAAPFDQRASFHFWCIEKLLTWLILYSFSVLFDSRSRCRWNEWLVPGQAGQQALVRWVSFCDAGLCQPAEYLECYLARQR
jgi:Glycosyl hydrolases family 16